MLQQLAAKKLIDLYEVDGGKKVLQILQWQERIRAGSKEKWPAKQKSQESAASRSKSQESAGIRSVLLPPSPSPPPPPSPSPSPPSAVSQSGRQPKTDPTFVTDYAEAKRLICERILNGKDPNRFWSADAENNLSKHLPIPRLEIERVAWFLGLPNDGSPELEARKPKTETGLMAYWGDEVTRANAFWQKLYGWREKKKAAG
jgi:hypothetical protein